MNGKTAKLLNGIKGKSHAIKRGWRAMSQRERGQERRRLEGVRQDRIADRARIKTAEEAGRL